MNKTQTAPHPIEELAEWLNHRYGSKRADFTTKQLHRKALELNDTVIEIIDTVGNKDFDGFVGFVDLVGFSSRVLGKPASEIENYLLCFLNPLIDLLRSNHCLVDKTIGDEVMFIMPNRLVESGLPAWSEMGGALNKLHSLRRKLGKDYPFRFALAYGKLRIAKVGEEQYSEWTTFGEPIHLAKRLTQLPELDSIVAEHGVGGVFGMLERDLTLAPGFEVLLAYLAGPTTNWRNQLNSNLKELKGVSKYSCHFILPNLADELS